MKKLVNAPVIRPWSFKERLFVSSPESLMRDPRQSQTKTRWLPSDLNEVSERQLLVQEIEAKKSYKVLNDEGIVKTGRPLKHKFLCTKKHRYIFPQKKSTNRKTSSGFESEKF